VDELRYTTFQKQLRHFRARTKHDQLHPLEFALVIILSAQFIFLPWALGTMWLWAQFTSATLSAAALVTALIPRHYLSGSTQMTPFQLVMWPKLVRFPLFWLGIAGAALLITQAANPSWAYQSNGTVWWMVQIPSIPYLPTGVQSPLSRGGPWRMLVVYSACWMTSCATWVGITRRRTVQILFLAIVANGTLLAILGIAQRLAGNGKVFWFVASQNPAFYSSFIYKNHAAAYLNLALAISCGLAAWYYIRGLRRLEKSNPAPVLLFVAATIAISVVMSYSRGATLTLVAYMVIATALFLFNQRTIDRSLRTPVVTVALILALAGFLRMSFKAFNSGQAWNGVRYALSGEDISVKGREYAVHASTSMLRDYWLRGAGGGSFRFLFPVYQVRFKDISNLNGQRLYWEHVHCDPIEFCIEFGVPGALLAFAASIYVIFQYFRLRVWHNPLSSSIIAGCIITIAHSFGDFVFHNPAILVHWTTLTILALMWAQLEELNTHP
jgi:hypothetical protein